MSFSYSPPPNNHDYLFEIATAYFYKLLWFLNGEVVLFDKAHAFGHLS